jgi:predicted enzyme related to lactoylglutathione lyase
VNTDDIQKTLDLVKLNGGIIIREKTEIPTIGWYGLFKDPEGNLIGLFKSL